MRLYDTLSKSVKELAKKEGEEVTLYTCGPTVYDHTHIGHMRKYVMDDVLKRSIEYLGYPVRHVMNITDVGHLTGDDDNGEDKIEKKAKTLTEITALTDEYTNEFIEVMHTLNIILPTFSKNAEFPDTGLLVRATDSISDMIALIKRIEKNGFTYATDEALYFDTTKFKDYGKLSGQKVEEKQQGVRDEVQLDPGKKHPADFALWFFLKGRFANHIQHWKSPWGEGFPGWHIECSAMSMRYLGETIDIHTGGIDHIPVHHENEIAQSESATGKKFVEFWVHDAFLEVNREKMSKSKGNFYTLKDVKEHTIDPIALRYLFLQTHYKKPMNFTWDAARGAESALQSLQEMVLRLKAENNEGTNENVDTIRDQFKESLSEDINVTKALAVMWEMLKKDISPKTKLDLLFEFDQVLGLHLKDIQSSKEEYDFPEDVKRLAENRLKARQEKDFRKSDELRDELEKKGYSVEDTPAGYKLKKI